MTVRVECVTTGPRQEDQREDFEWVVTDKRTGHELYRFTDRDKAVRWARLFSEERVS